MHRTGLNRLAHWSALALIGIALIGCEPTVQQVDDSKLADELRALRQEQNQLQRQIAQLNREKQALARVTELERILIAANPGAPLREHLEQEHRQSKQNGYQAEFHAAMRQHAGERLQHEWRSYCRAKPSAPTQELDCR